MRLKIVQAGEPVLRETARLLTPQEILSEEIQRLIRDMREAMHDAPGVGLAAPQIGQPFQLAVIEDREDLLKSYAAADLAERERRAVPFHVIINPVIAYRVKKQKISTKAASASQVFPPSFPAPAPSASNTSTSAPNLTSSKPPAGTLASSGTK